MPMVSVDYKVCLSRAMLTYAELCTQQLPIGSVFTGDSSTTINRYTNKPTQVEYRKDFKDFGLQIREEDVQEGLFPASKCPIFNSECAVKCAFKANVLNPISECFNNNFKILMDESLGGNGTPDMTLLNCSTGYPFLVIEAKPWYWFNEENKAVMENTQEIKEALEKCVVIDSFSSLDNKKEENESNNQYQYRLSMRQLRYYLFSMGVIEAYGILTSYCHTFLVILRRTEKANKLFVSPVLKFSDRDPLKKISEFIFKAYKSKREELSVSDPVKISSVRAMRHSANYKNQENSMKRGRHEEEEDGIKKKSKTVKSEEDDQEICYPYIVTNLISEGRHGAVFRILNEEKCPFLAKCLPDKCNKTVMGEFQNEKKIYQKLSSLQGKVLPRFYFAALMDGWRETLIIEQLPAIPISQCSYLSEEEKMAIADSLRRIHQEGILHGDIRKENILIDRSKKKAYFIDFAFGSEGSSDVFEQEMIELKALLNDL